MNMVKGIAWFAAVVVDGTIDLYDGTVSGSADAYTTFGTEYSAQRAKRQAERNAANAPVVRVAAKRVRAA